MLWVALLGRLFDVSDISVAMNTEMSAVKQNVLEALTGSQSVHYASATFAEQASISSSLVAHQLVRVCLLKPLEESFYCMC